MVSLPFPGPKWHLILRWPSEAKEAVSVYAKHGPRDHSVKILRGQLALPVVDRCQTRADRIALIRHRLNGFELRQAAREERRRRKRPGAKRETRQLSLLEIAGE